METPQRRKWDMDKAKQFFKLETIRQAVPPLLNHRLVMLGLILLNAILLIAAIATGIKCATAKRGSLQVSHTAAATLIGGLEDLKSNHSNVMEAREEAKTALDTALKNHTQIKRLIVELKDVNDKYQRQTEVLETERASLKANYTALTEGCGCPSKWVHFNYSCYLFSYTVNSGLKMNWEDSRQDCIKHGADLIIIDKPEEQTFVSHAIELMKSGRHFSENSFWIGLRDTDEEGTWVWINNVTEVEQRYWMDGEPNDSGYHGEDCGATFYSYQSPWKTRNDANCKQNRIHWICEKPLK